MVTFSGRNQKGGGGERQVAKLLQAWWRQLDPQARFVRVPRSGGWLYGPEFGACGDVMAKADPPLVFGVEVKRHERWTMQNLLAGEPSPVWAWWRQCQDDAKKLGKEPMLWFRKNRQPWLVLLRRKYVAGLAIEPPDAVWPWGLRRAVDCQAVPVMYLGERLLAQPPSAFVG